MLKNYIYSIIDKEIKHYDLNVYKDNFITIRMKKYIKKKEVVNMSWDQSSRIIEIKTIKKNEKDILSTIKKLNNNLIDKFSIDKEYDGDNLIIILEEYGYTKHGSFSNRNTYNLRKFIKDIIDLDKENILIYAGHDSFFNR